MNYSKLISLALHKRLIQMTFCLVLLAIQSSPALAQKNPNLPPSPFNYRVNLPAHLQWSGEPNQISEGKINNIATLGRVLFYDNSLSANHLVSCASCHKQINGFDDPTRFSIGFKGLITARNAMGLTNSRFNANGRYFWDERATSLRHQVLQPFFDPIEMGLRKSGLVPAVAKNRYYPNLFVKAFGDQAITNSRIAEALAEFIRAIVSTRAPYDIARQQVADPIVDFPRFNALQNRGKMLFFQLPANGGAGCISCHQSEAFISPPQGANNGLDLKTPTDKGVGAITNNSMHFGNFRPPSLRNISVRAPFMHDGRFDSLEKVIEHYSTRIQPHANLGLALRDERGNARRFKFSRYDKSALLAFLQTLSDEHLLKDPKFSNPFR